MMMSYCRNNVEDRNFKHFFPMANFHLVSFTPCIAEKTIRENINNETDP